MRTAHEAFRAAMKEAGELLDGPPENKAAFIKIWRELQLCISAHKDMEELDVFPMLDAVKPGCVIDANISSLHVADDINVHDINQLIMRPDMKWDELRTAYNDWRDFHENHLCKEEEIMKETVSKIAPTAAARCLVVHDKMINTALLRSREELEALVAFCVSKMNRYGSQKMSPKEEVILFVRGLRGVSNKDQWEEFMPLCKKNCNAEIWEEMVNKYNIEEAEDGHLCQKH